VPSNVLKKTDANICDSKMISPSSSIVSLNVLPLIPSDLSQSIFSTVLTTTTINDSENALNKRGERRYAQRHVAISRDTQDLVVSIDSTSLSRPFSPKRSHPASDSSSSLSKTPTPKKSRQKRVKPSAPNTVNKQTSYRDHLTTTIGNLKLKWPSYDIKNAFYAGEYFSIFHTCPIDTGLFVLYYAYKAGTDDFRILFESDTLHACTLLRRTFQLVESDGWTVARLYWLTENNLLKEKTEDGRYDLMNTMDTIVFNFTKPMQTFPIKSKCSCNACPKQIREHMSVDISLT
jgi:hypothetical protein